MDLVKDAAEDPQGFSPGRWVLQLLDMLFGRARESNAPTPTPTAASPEAAPMQYLREAPEEIKPWMYRQLFGPQQPSFAPWELHEFSRLGVDPMQMSQLPRISQFMRNIRMQEQMLRNAFRGESLGFGGEEPELPAGAQIPQSEMSLPGKPSPSDLSRYV